MIRGLKGVWFYQSRIMFYVRIARYSFIHFSDALMYLLLILKSLP